MVKKLHDNAGDARDVCSIPGSGRFPGGGMATHSSVLAWRVPQTEEPEDYSPCGPKSQTQLSN